MKYYESSTRELSGVETTSPRAKLWNEATGGSTNGKSGGASNLSASHSPKSGNATQQATGPTLDVQQVDTHGKKLPSVR
jgi:hypothetical protein